MVLLAVANDDLNLVASGKQIISVKIHCLQHNMSRGWHTSCMGPIRASDVRDTTLGEANSSSRYDVTYSTHGFSILVDEGN